MRWNQSVGVRSVAVVCCLHGASFVVCMLQQVALLYTTTLTTTGSSNFHNPTAQILVNDDGGYLMAGWYVVGSVHDLPLTHAFLSNKQHLITLCVVGVVITLAWLAA